MADLFELSASLTLDISRFEAEVRRAEALASGLQGRLNSLCGAVDAAMGRLRALDSLTGGVRTLPSLRAVQTPEARGGTLTADELAAALASALRGVTVQMDSREVGTLVAPTVDRIIGREAGTRRYTG